MIDTDYVRGTCRYCHKPVVHTAQGWRVVAGLLRQEDYYEETAWFGCPKAPATLGFIGTHEAQIEGAE